MPYYNTALTLTETSDYTATNAIIVDAADAITGSTVPNSVISHTAGSSSTAEDWVLQIGNSTHYLELTSTGHGTFDLYLGNNAHSGNVQTTSAGYSAGEIVVPTILWSANVLVISYGGQSTSAVVSYFACSTSSNWYANFSGTSALYVYANGSDSTQSYSTFAYPAQLSDNLIIMPIYITSSNEVVDAAQGLIGYSDANNLLYPSPGIQTYGSNHYYWFYGLAVSDEV